ncbi:MAG TPA: 5-formyltetrahydrofolate cyclo-ligase [Chthoniobacterales bacterium]|jgi:5-formyltetrahydrofolate cyclo-ligase
MTPNPTGEKAALRAEMIKRLRQLTAEDRQSLSEEICERVLEMTEWNEAQSVVLFSPLPSEPIITPLKLDCDARRAACVIIPQSARNEHDLRLPEKIDLILVPGLAFSQDKHRLGRGGGFFDQLLAGRAEQAFKLGLCFSFQVLPAVPVEGHDIVMDAVVTDLDR